MTQGYQMSAGPLNITQTLQAFFDNVVLEHGGLPHVLSLAVHLYFFGVELVEGVIQCYSFSLISY